MLLSGLGWRHSREDGRVVPGCKVTAHYTVETDEELAWQTRAGSSAAFEELVHRYEHRVYAFLMQHLQDRQDAREVTQDTFVKAFRAIDQFDTRRAFATWLFTIARRKCIDRHRGTRKAEAEPMPELVDPHTPAETLAAIEERAAVWTLARRQLPPLQYQALWLRYAEEMTVAQIAQVLRKTRIHIKVLLFRARQTLSLHLKGPARSHGGQRLSPMARPDPGGKTALAVQGHFVPLAGRND